MRAAMIDYGVRILDPVCCDLGLYGVPVVSCRARYCWSNRSSGVVGHMQSYAAAPEDARRIIAPTAGVTELREAEEALKSLQTELTGALRQKERLAQLGSRSQQNQPRFAQYPDLGAIVY